MKNIRIEKDMFGERKLDTDALYGINALRAAENFPLSGRKVNSALIQAFGYVKLACVITNYELGFINKNIFPPIEQACREMIQGKLDRYIITDALQGGAGTSVNMNVNEVIANRALIIMNKKPGDYDIVHPLNHINLHQSTNDTYPTALKVAAIFELRKLEEQLVKLIRLFQDKEKKFADIVKISRTEMQDAVLTTMGRTMSAYAEALGRDRWRIFKCEERLRVINLGGTAIGTGITAPRQYIFKAAENLKKLTGIGLARAGNLVECTQNNDSFVEVSGILNALASTLLKVCGDLRFLSSGPDAGIAELILPQRQQGSSLMPGKVNPVIPEAVSQAAICAITNNTAITYCVSMGHLELNPFMPLIADKLLETIRILTNAVSVLGDLCVAGIRANRKQCEKYVNSSVATVTALLPKLGYDKATELIHESKETGKTIKDTLIEKGWMTREEFETLTSPQAVNALGSPIRK